MEYMSDDFGQVFLAKGGNLLSLALKGLTAASNKSIEDIANGSPFLIVSDRVYSRFRLHPLDAFGLDLAELH